MNKFKFNYFVHKTNFYFYLNSIKWKLTMENKYFKYGLDSEFKER